MPRQLSYTLVTPVRDEEKNLERLAASVAAQLVQPHAWLIVDTGSTDATPQLAARIARQLPYATVSSIDGPALPTRGAPVVRAIHSAVATIEPPVDVVIKLDADLSFEPDYCQRLLEEFSADPHLGLAGGICTELETGEWRPQFGARSHISGASRAYRWDCLQAVLPLEEREGWDDIDSIKAQLRGWRVRTLADVPFRHHRALGLRDGSTRVRWTRQGRTAHFMGYRFSYLVARALWQARRDPAALLMVPTYLKAVIGREPRCPDPAVRDRIRNEQRIRHLPLRLRESVGRVV